MKHFPMFLLMLLAGCQEASQTTDRSHDYITDGGIYVRDEMVKHSGAPSADEIDAALVSAAACLGVSPDPAGLLIVFVDSLDGDKMTFSSAEYSDSIATISHGRYEWTMVQNVERAIVAHLSVVNFGSADWADACFPHSTPRDSVDHNSQAA